MRPGFVLFLIAVLALTAATLAVAPLWSDALPLPNWYALAFSAGAIAVACGALYVNMQNLGLARRREERDLAALEEKRQRETRESAEREAKRLAWLAQFKELPLPPGAEMAGRSFVYEWPAGWERDVPDRVGDPCSREEGLWLKLGVWAVEGYRPAAIETTHPAPLDSRWRLIYETDETRSLWRRKVALRDEGSPTEWLLITRRTPGDAPPPTCLKCWRFVSAGGGSCPQCGQSLAELAKTNAEILAQRQG